ncbi:hypothetical protein B0H13DRAFT_2356567 [Mycena leptocephala]|nr:hypothetical protein B0H13DRAFT_2356567 [Mycena leptocephala]
MLSFALLSTALLFSEVSISLASVALVPRGAEVVCEGQITLSEEYIGQNKDVLVQYSTCPGYGSNVNTLDTRQIVDATLVASLPRVEDPSQMIAILLRTPCDSTVKTSARALFTMGTGTNNTVVIQFASCLSFFVNQDTAPVEYCRTDWASLIDFIAPNCQATQNAHGGLCIATNQQWFAQVQHS